MPIAEEGIVFDDIQGMAKGSVVFFLLVLAPFLDRVDQNIDEVVFGGLCEGERVFIPGGHQILACVLPEFFVWPFAEARLARPA